MFRHTYTVWIGNKESHTKSIEENGCIHTYFVHVRRNKNMQITHVIYIYTYNTLMTSLMYYPIFFLQYQYLKIDIIIFILYTYFKFSYLNFLLLFTFVHFIFNLAKVYHMISYMYIYIAHTCVHTHTLHSLILSLSISIYVIHIIITPKFIFSISNPFDLYRFQVTHLLL